MFRFEESDCIFCIKNTMKMIIVISSSSHSVVIQHQHQQKENELDCITKILKTYKIGGKPFILVLGCFLPKVLNAKYAISQLDKPHNYITMNIHILATLVYLSRSQLWCPSFSPRMSAVIESEFPSLTGRIWYRFPSSQACSVLSFLKCTLTIRLELPDVPQLNWKRTGFSCSE